MNNAFYRLRWLVFKDVLNIGVVSDLDSLNLELLPFLGHLIAGESESKIPLWEMLICIDA